MNGAQPSFHVLCESTGQRVSIGEPREHLFAQLLERRASLASFNQFF